MLQEASGLFGFQKSCRILSLDGESPKRSKLRYSSKGTLIQVMREHDFGHAIAEGARMYVHPGSATSVLVSHHISEGALSELKVAAWHLRKV